ncbi:YppG family protein [Oceanobacillus sp. CFH 90083]|uniref:YppG family protein n=1 Tax=Oceanobacillus sp. CFH 90083 TaxID=2592336 RepID=UPI001883F833|nr:YppG family protein [Oceanobacillus sp. CFH 90083]
MQYQEPYQRNEPSNEWIGNNPYVPVSSNINQRNTRQELTPYDLFSKPELPTQYIMSQQQIQSQSGMGAGGATENNPFNFDTMISKVSQLASTYHQVSPIVKQFSTFVKGFM